MTGMKRWLAGLLAAALLFSGTALAEGSGPDTVDIQESLVSREGDTSRTVEESLLLLVKLLQRDEVRHMLQIQDVYTITTDVVLEVLGWMAEHRTVTIKILREFGFGETDIRCVEKLWDSADRISAASAGFRASEQGQQLAADFDALMDDPDFQKSAEDLLAVFSSEDLRNMMQSLAETVQEEAEQAAAEGPLTQEALEQRLNLTSFTGSLVLALLQAVETSGAAQESVPKLLMNDRLWTFLVHLADMGGEADRVIRAEILALAGDAEVMDFLRRTAQGLLRVAETLREAEKPETETEEAAP